MAKRRSGIEGSRAAQSPRPTVLERRARKVVPIYREPYLPTAADWLSTALGPRPAWRSAEGLPTRPGASPMALGADHGQSMSGRSKTDRERARRADFWVIAWRSKLAGDRDPSHNVPCHQAEGANRSLRKPMFPRMDAIAGPDPSE